MAETTITIPDLGSLTSGQVSDLLLVTRGTTGYKMLVSDIAKTIIETYAGSSLAGSSQSVKSALDSLNSSIVYTSTTQSEFSDANDLRTHEGKILIVVAAKSVHANVPENGILIQYRLGDTIVRQMLMSQTSAYFRSYISGAWQSWSLLGAKLLTAASGATVTTPFVLQPSIWVVNWAIGTTIMGTDMLWVVNGNMAVISNSESTSKPSYVFNQDNTVTITNNGSATLRVVISRGQ